MAKIYDFNRYAQRINRTKKRKTSSSNYGVIIKFPQKTRRKSLLKSIISRLFTSVSIVLLYIIVRVKNLVVSKHDVKKHQWKSNTKRMGLAIPENINENFNKEPDS